MQLGQARVACAIHVLDNKKVWMPGTRPGMTPYEDDPMPKTPDYFHGKTIVITGAASGIGRATALIFAREGANVVCADIDEDGVAKTLEAINKFDAQALALTIDVTKRAAVQDMIELAINDFGRVHFLFNSAGAA